MTKISDYEDDVTISGSDRLIGTDGVTGETKEFPIESLRNYLGEPAPPAEPTESSASYDVWKAVINTTSVVNVLEDTLGFTDPTVAVVANGIIEITKTDFFTDKDKEKIDLKAPPVINNGGVPYVCVLEPHLDYFFNSIRLKIWDMAGGQISTPNTSYTVEIRIYKTL